MGKLNKELDVKKTLSPLASGTLAILMVGCDAIDDFQLNNMVAEYRQTCFGQFTNDCVEMRVDTNIEIVSRILDGVEEREGELKASIGESGYDEMVGYLNWLIDINEKDRPGWFTSLFLGEAQPWDRNFKYGQLLISEHEVKDAFDNIAERHMADTLESRTMTNAIQSAEPLSTANEPDVTASEVSSPQDLEAAYVQDQSDTIDSYIAGMERQHNADEYRDGRMYAEGDVDGDGALETATIFTLEGFNGTNRYGQFLVVHSEKGSGAYVVGETPLAGSATDLELGSGVITAIGFTHAVSDPSCCPSIKSEQTFEVTGSGLVKVE